MFRGSLQTLRFELFGGHRAFLIPERDVQEFHPAGIAAFAGAEETAEHRPVPVGICIVSRCVKRHDFPFLEPAALPEAVQAVHDAPFNEAIAVEFIVIAQPAAHTPGLLFLPELFAVIEKPEHRQAFRFRLFIVLKDIKGK